MTESLSTFIPKPRELIISDLKWKYLLRGIVRGKNIMIVGPTGTAKTMSVRCAAKALSEVVHEKRVDDNGLINLKNDPTISIESVDFSLVRYRVKRNLFIINCGGGQDARATLIGNTGYRKDQGTFFSQSPFVTAIQTPNSIILLDELTRGSHDFWNILIPVLDPTQRSLRLDEEENSPVINVSPGVCFIATANIGNEYTATRTLDKAASRRFPVKLEMETLDKKQLTSLFLTLYPKTTSVQKELLDTLCEISEDLREQCVKEDAEISSYISTASLIEMSELVFEGFTLEEIAEVAIYPEYRDDGMEGERAFVKSLVQKYIPQNIENPIRDPRKKPLDTTPVIGF